MKKTAENRYPHSATLFRFCKEALELRYDGNVKVIDQDVGAILGYDPADCSHWKKGKKNIRSLSTLKSMAEHLNIDERLLIDIAAGKISLEEALFEYKGYGLFSLETSHLENFKKEYFRNPSRWTETSGSKRPFEELFDINRPAVTAMASHILKDGDFAEAPIYLPEVFQLFANAHLETDENLGESVIAELRGEQENKPEVFIKYRGPEMRPFVRYLVAKNLFKFLCHSKHEHAKAFHNSPEEIIEIQSNIFASTLLIPGFLLRKEVEKLNSSFDIVQQLADIFWVSKTLMNRRLTDYMDYFN